ncbi:MAG: hypothetical protein IT445_13960 [Phycisphaeraceae bacterium]|nr:hypothetical protein [Phycisphaeraceae bacterium]
MYELTCPSCHQVMRASFVRAGAVATCAGCGQRFLIDKAHYHRLTPAAPAPGPGSEQAGATSATGSSVPGAIPGALPGAGVRVDESGHVIGLSGLSEMMRREAAAARHAAAAPPASDPAWKRPRRHRSTWLMLLLLLGVIGTIGASGVLVWVSLERPAPPQLGTPVQHDASP